MSSSYPYAWYRSPCANISINDLWMWPRLLLSPSASTTWAATSRKLSFSQVIIIPIDLFVCLFRCEDNEFCDGLQNSDAAYITATLSIPPKKILPRFSLGWGHSSLSYTHSYAPTSQYIVCHITLHIQDGIQNPLCTLYVILLYIFKMVRILLTVLFVIANRWSNLSIYSSQCGCHYKPSGFHILGGKQAIRFHLLSTLPHLQLHGRESLHRMRSKNNTPAHLVFQI